MLSQATGGLSAGSLAAAADSLQELHVDLSKWGATPPAEGWKGWSRELRAAVKEAESALQGSGIALQHSKSIAYFFRA